MSTLVFDQLEVPTPVYDEVAEQYRQIEESLIATSKIEDLIEVINRWDKLRRKLETWEALTDLHFNQDTQNRQYKQEREKCDELRPKLIELDVRIKRRLINSLDQAELKKRLGKQAFALWEAEITTYDPIIEKDMVQESKLEVDYIELKASASLLFAGKQHTLEEIVQYRENADRQTRQTAEEVRWNWFAENSNRLDEIFDSLVKLRHLTADKLGFKDFVELGYRRLTRIDYGLEEVEKFRDTVREQVVPLAEEIHLRQKKKLGIDRLYYWDESLHDPAGNPTLFGSHDWLLRCGRRMFDAMGGEVGELFKKMTESGLLDLKSRPGKAGGGFCTAFPSYGLPFIFANFNGTKGDVEVFTHEMGHALQSYLSRDLPLLDYLWPTLESSEIHSMSLEFLTWKWMPLFFGEDSERFCKIHLTQSLLFLPYAAAVDHFQHLVYKRPDVAPSERCVMWQEVEKIYLPWRDYGELARPASGGFWQTQGHIYSDPFYYIDYALALCCALQFWVRSQKDFPQAIITYTALCRRGGELPFQELLSYVGLKSPFAEGSLNNVITQAKEYLGI